MHINLGFRNPIIKNSDKKRLLFILVWSGEYKIFMQPDQRCKRSIRVSLSLVGYEKISVLMR